MLDIYHEFPSPEVFLGLSSLADALVCIYFTGKQQQTVEYTFKMCFFYIEPPAWVLCMRVGNPITSKTYTYKLL